MANLTAPRTLEFVGEQDEISPKVAASVTFYKGGLLTFDTNGVANKPTDGAAQFPAGLVTGVYEEGVRDDAYAVPATAKRAILKRGKVWLPFSGAAQTNVGEVFYIADDQTLTQTAGTKTVGLIALDFKTGYLLFDLRQYDRIA